MINSNILFETTDVFAANHELMQHKKICVNQGGTSSGKTYSIEQLLAKIAVECSRYKHKVITVVGQDIPNLKKGALRDFQNIVSSSQILQSAIKSYNKTDRTYTLNNGFLIEFNSYSDWQDAKSGKRDYLFINEANGISLRVYEQLALRTEHNIFIDYNPDAEFWVHSNLIGKPDVGLIISDHRHNTFLSPETHAKIEAIDDPELWKVYARGLTGKLEGVIFRYDVIPNVPEGMRKVGTGLDYGFTNDPTAVIDVYCNGGDLVLDELIYDTGLVNVPVAGVNAPNISDRMLEEGLIMSEADIVAESAEQKSNQELRNAGWHVEDARKGPDSVRNGIDLMKRYKIKVTARSSNLKKELNTYKWRQNKNGDFLNEPVDFRNHLIDAARYVCLNRLGRSSIDWDRLFN